MSLTRMDSDDYKKKLALAKMLKNGVIMDVTNVEQAKIAEDSGACAVMALERVPSQIRKEGGVARMSDPQMIIEIKESVSIPVMAKARIGHIAEAKILEAIGVDFIDESEVLTPADDTYHIDKFDYTIPFVCGCKNLGEALRRINEGAVMIRTKGEAGTGDIVEAVKHMRTLIGEINYIKSKSLDELYNFAKEIQAPYELIKKIKDTGEFLVPNFSAGGVAIPADAALMMQLGAESVFVGSGIFTSENPKKMAKAIVDAVSYYKDNKKLLEISKGLGSAMRGISVKTIEEKEKMANRGW